MTRKRRPQGDPIEQEIELVLNPNTFITDHACFSFVNDLDEVAAKMAKLQGVQADLRRLSGPCASQQPIDSVTPIDTKEPELLSGPAGLLAWTFAQFGYVL